MGRYPTIEKFIKGRRVTEAEYKRAIIDVLDLLPDGGRAADIAKLLDPAWDTIDGRKIIHNTLGLMERQGLVSRVEGKNGLFAATERAHRSGVSKFEDFELGLKNIIRDHGGAAKFTEIMDVLRDVSTDSPDRKEFTFTYTYRRARIVIDKSTQLRRDTLPYGWYSLPPEEINAMPLTGRTAMLFMKASGIEGHKERMKAFKEEDPVEDWLFTSTDWFTEVRDATFKRIGEAWKGWREFKLVDIETIVADEDVAEAMRGFYNKAPKLVADIRDEAYTEFRKRPPVEGMSRTKAFEIEFDANIHAWMFAEFEAGRLEAHTYAPIQFYEAVSSFFGLCPIGFSRGIIMRDGAL